MLLVVGKDYVEKCSCEHNSAGLVEALGCSISFIASIGPLQQCVVAFPSLQFSHVCNGIVVNRFTIMNAGVTFRSHI